MKTVHLAGCAALLVGSAVPAAGLAQDNAVAAMDGAAAIRCSQLQGQEAPAAAAMVYYIAGYGDAQRDAMTLALGGTLEGAATGAEPAVGQQPSAEPAPAGAAQPAPGQEAPAQPAPVQQGSAASGPPPTLTLSADQVISACAQSPDTRVLDIITSQGGSGMTRVRTPNTTDAAPAPAQ